MRGNARFDTPVNTAGRLVDQCKGHARERLCPAGQRGRVSRSGIFLRGDDCAALGQSGGHVVETLRGETVDWERDFAQALRGGVDAFRIYVGGRYGGRFHWVIFSDFRDSLAGVRGKQMICSVLAGYARNCSNPFVADSERRLTTVEQLCALLGSQA